MSTFNLPFSVFIADRKPVDDRYVVNDEVERLNIGNSYRSFDGLQIYQKDTKKLYILNDYLTSTWVEVGGNQLSGITSLENTYIGVDSYNNTTGTNNTFVGVGSGYNNTGSNNVFIGYQSGYNEVGSDKLYISNSNTSNPLIYGEFNNSLLKINGNLYLSGITNSATSYMLYFDLITGKVTYSTVSNLSIGGSNTHVQFNDNGILGGNNGFVYNKTTYDLTLLGLIRGSNIHTNTISQSTKLGQLTGFFEDETTQRNNSFIGYQAGRYIYTGSGNTFIGSFSGLKQAGASSNNTFIGYLSGGNGDSSNANNNTYIGYKSGYYNGAGGVSNTGNVAIGYMSGAYGTYSNKLFIDNQDRSNEPNSRVASLIYGEFNSTPSNQLLRINSKLQLPYISNSATTNVLYYDLVTSGVSYGVFNSASPGGVNNSIQINNNGIFGGLEDPILMSNGVLNFIYSDDNTNGYVFRDLNHGINFLYEGYEYKLNYYSNISDLSNSNTNIFKINSVGDTTMSGKLYANISNNNTQNIVYYDTISKEFSYGLFNLISGTTDSNYTYIGYNSGLNSTGSGNTYLGKSNGINNTANYNTFIGHESGYYNANGDSNTFIGYQSGYNNIGGYRNVMVGVNTGRANTSGFYNTFVGYESGNSNTTGAGNSFFGYATGSINNGSNNTFIGNLSGFQANSTSSTFVGYQSGYNTTGINNVFLGAFVGQSNTTGENNTYVGYGAGYSNINGVNNVFIGYQAGYNETGSNKLYISNSNTSNPLIYGEFNNSLLKINGNLYLSGITNSATSYMLYFDSITGKISYSNSSNVNVGGLNTHVQFNDNGVLGGESGLTYDKTFMSFTCGGVIKGSNITTNSVSKSTYIGLYNGTSEDASTIRENVSIGYEAGKSITVAPRNVFVGYQAGYSNSGGGYNIFIGYKAGYSNTNQGSNVFIGHTSGELNNSGNNNTFVGYNSGDQNTTGINNTFYGYRAGHANTVGNYNVYIGSNAGYFETGSNKLIIDNNARSNESTARTNSMIYGIFSTTMSTQELHLNARIYARHLTNSAKTSCLYYDTTTKEISYGDLPSGGSTTSYQTTGSTTFTTLTLVDSYSNTKDFCVYYYTVYSGTTEKRSGVITINNTTTQVTMNEVNTDDIGDTSGVVFTVDNNVGGNGLVRLYVNTNSGGTWTCKFIKNII